MNSALAPWQLPLSEQDCVNVNRQASWWTALNPPIYLVSVLPGLGVLLIAGESQSWLAGLALGTAAVVLLQHAINLLNDVSDWRLGADVHKYDSWVRVHEEDTRIASLHGLASALAGTLLGIGLLLWSDRLWILAIAAPMVVLGYLYNTGPRPLSYTTLGEWVTGLCYGPGVFGCLWLLAGLPLQPAAAFGMLAFAALAMALLLSHQPPQIETDRAAGKHSFAVRYGAHRTWLTSRWLAVLFLVSAAMGIGLGDTRVVTIAVFAFTGLVAIVYLCRVRPNPRRILLPSTGVIIAGLIASAL
jgi:1,4-dihydroxy-2-naphthoate octaprenyltransferase